MRLPIIACCLLVGCVDEQNLGFTGVGVPRWAVALGGEWNDRGLATAIDSNGDVIVVGDHAGPAEFGTGCMTTGAGAFITKRAANDGSEKWTVELPGTVVEVMDVAIDADDSVVVTGSYVGAVDFGGQTLSLDEPTPPSHGDMFVAKYAPDGQLQWVHGMSATTNVAGLALAIDHVGRIIVAGTFSNGAVALNGRLFIESDGENDTFVAAYDPFGTLLWGDAFQGRGGPVPTSVAIDHDDNVLVVGSFFAPASFGGSTLDPGAYGRAFIARFGKDGRFRTAGVLGAGGSGESWAGQVGVSSSLTVVQTGERASLGDAAYGALHILDNADHEVWSATLVDNGSSNPQARTLAIAPSGMIMSGAWDDAPYDADHRDQVGGSMEVAAYDPVGQGTTATFGCRLLGAPQNTLARASAASSTGSVAFTGEFAGMVDFGAGPLGTHGQDDIDAFVVLLDPPHKP